MVLGRWVLELILNTILLEFISGDLCCEVPTSILFIRNSK